MDNPEGKVTYLHRAVQTAGLPTSSGKAEGLALRFYPVRGRYNLRPPLVSILPEIRQ